MVADASALDVLLVDDDPEYRVLVARMLRAAGPAERRYRIHEHDGGVDLEARLAAGGFDCCLLDQRLGGRSGLDVLAGYERSADHAPVVMLTAFDDEDTVAACLERGAADFLSKDELNPRLLDRTIRYCVHQDRLRRELAASRRRLAANERLAAMGMIAAGIAHEFNNQGAVVMGNVEYAMALIGEHPAKRRLERVVEVVERGSGITRALLNMARNCGPLGDAGCDAAAIARHVLELCEPLLRVGGIELRPVLPADAWVALAACELQQVLFDLLINAAHAVARTERPAIDLAIRPSGDWVVIEVADNGVGIPADWHESVFQPFFTGKGPFDEAGRYPEGIEGTGLGLAMCEHVVTRRGGVIDLRSAEGSGACFTLTLPAAVAGHVAEESSAILPVITGSAMLDVVVVDPDPDALRLVVMGLTHETRRIRSFSDGAAALASIGHELPQVVVVDHAVDGGRGRPLVDELASRLEAEDLDLMLITDRAPPQEELAQWPFRSLRVLRRPLGTRRVAEALLRVQGSR